MKNLTQVFETFLGELLCGTCGYELECDECGDMPETCPECGSHLSYEEQYNQR